MESKEFAGGYTDIFLEGVVKNVVHCDATSLYPSIMLEGLRRPRMSLMCSCFLARGTFRVEAKVSLSKLRVRKNAPTSKRCRRHSRSD
jgi:hypothetical protein